MIKFFFKLLSDRERISAELMHLLDDATDPWGIKVISNNENVLTKILRLKE